MTGIDVKNVVAVFPFFTTLARNVQGEAACRNALNFAYAANQVHNDGMLSLHTRSLRYGKLGQGCCVVVSPSLIKRRKNHIHNLPFGATIILANNGYVWISSTSIDDESTG